MSEEPVIAIAPRALASVCRLLGCQLDEAVDRVNELENVGGRYLQHESGARLMLALVLPFDRGAVWRVWRIERPQVEQVRAAPRWSAVDALRAAGWQP